MTLTFSCYQLLERQLAQLSSEKPNFLYSFDNRNITFQIKTLLYRDNSAPLSA